MSAQKNFEAWFHGSKAVKRDGTPLVLYHGTQADIAAFEADRETMNYFMSRPYKETRLGIFFAEDPEFASSFALQGGGVPEGANVVPVHLAARKVLDLTEGFGGLHSDDFALLKPFFAENEWALSLYPHDMWELFDKGTVGGPEFVKAVKAAGFDGVVTVEAREGKPDTPVWIVFEPAQIKSAIGNDGQYQVAVADIRFSAGAGAELAAPSVHAAGRLMPVDQLPEQLRAEIRALEAIGASAGHFIVEAATLLNEPDMDAGIAPVEAATYSGEANAPVFYSALARGIETAMPRDKQGMISPSQAQAWIASKAREGRLFKSSEVEWSGVKEFLESAPPKFAVADLVRAVAEEGVQIADVIYGGPDAEEQKHEQNEKVRAIAERLFAALNAWPQELTIDGIRINTDELDFLLLDGDVTPDQLPEPFQDDAAEWIAGYKKLLDFSPIENKPSLYHNYTAPFGANYRELLITSVDASARLDPERSAYEQWCRNSGNSPSSTYAEQAYARATGLSAPPPITMTQRREMEAKQFASSHFRKVKNIVAHVRFDERVGANGERVLFINELQSDWGQTGKKRGFRSAEGSVLPAGYVVSRHDSDAFPFAWVLRNAEGKVMGPAFGATSEAEAARTAAHNLDAATGTVPMGPFVMKTEQWVSLAVKRMIRYAAENGFDQVAIISGKQSADLYDLRKNVDSIVVMKTVEGFHVTGWLGDPTKPEVEKTRVIDKAVADVNGMSDLVGKELAERASLVCLADGDIEIFSGDALAVGGNGMLYFYDVMVPNVIKDVLKKLGSGKVEPIKVDVTDYGYSGRTEEKAKYAALREHTGFAITPEMRSTVMHGLPMFRRENTSGQQPVLAMRQGDISPDGAYFATYGTSTYFDPDNRNIGKFDISAVAIIDTNVPSQAIALLEETLKDNRLTDIQRERLRGEIAAVNEHGGGIGYMVADELPLADAGKRLGFDGMNVVENDDWTSGSSVFIWNTKLVRAVSEAEFQTQLRAQYGDDAPGEDDAFRAWFGNSVVVTPDMEPMKLYHGTGANTGSVFLPNTFFTPSPSIAAIYANAPTRQVEGDAPNISAVFMRLENPYIFDAHEVNDNLSHHVLGKRGSTEAVCQYLKAQGYDGLVLKNYLDLGGMQDQYVAFTSEQIKSATGNIGAFDRGSGDIRFRREEQAAANPKFAEWFGDSKIVDASGAPLMVFHGTYSMSGFDSGKFSYDAKGINDYGDSETGFFFGSSDVANAFASGGEDSGIIPVYLSMRKPFVIAGDEFVRMLDTYTFSKWDKLKRAAVVSGYDGFLIKTDDTARDSEYHHQFASDNYVVFNPAQIKSAIGNNGEYDPANDDIRFRREPALDDDFSEWFSGSEVVAEDGSPLVVHHRTHFEFSPDQFDRLHGAKYFGRNTEGIDTVGIWFTDSPNTALYGPNNIDVHLSIKHPLVLRDDAEGTAWEQLEVMVDGVGGTSNLRRELTAEYGHDGIKLDRTALDGTVQSVWIAFEPEQIRGIERPAPSFDKWFGSSKVISETGSPLVVFHGTGAPDFTAFEKSMLGASTGGADAKQGFFFAENPSSAEQFIWKDGDKVGAIYPVYLALQHPKVISDFVLTGANGTAAGRLIAEAKAQGHDGVIFAESDMLGHVGRSYVAFEPTQIKSAIGNDGTFDSQNPDIRFRRQDPQSIGWSEARVERLLSAYSYPAKPRKTKAFAAMISPQEFLRLTATANALEQIAEETGPLDLAELERQAQEMYLRVDGLADEMPRVDGHEGRHRAYALQHAGYDLIPVVLYFGEGREVDALDRMLLLPQKFHSSRVALGSAWLQNLTPLSQEYKTQLLEHFVAGMNVQFRKETVAEESKDVPGHVAPVESKENFKKWFDGSKIVAPDGKPLVVYHGTTSDFSEFRSMAPATIYKLDDAEIQQADSWDMGEDRCALPEAFHHAALSSALQLGADEALKRHVAEVIRTGRCDADAARCLHDLRRLTGKTLAASTEMRPTNDGFYFTPDMAYSYVRDIGAHSGGNVMPLYLSIKNPIYLDASQIERAGASFNVEKYKTLGFDGAVFAERPHDLTRRGYNGSVQIVAFDPTQIKSAIGNNGDYDPSIEDIRFRSTAGAIEYSRPAPTAKSSPSAEIDALQALARAFNSRLGMLKLAAESTFQFSGVHLNGAIWLNTASQKPYHAVFGHELTHQMQHERPDLYSALVAAVEPLLVNRDGYRAMMGLQGMSAEHLRDEMVADLVGDRFAEKSFWDMVAVRSGPAFKGIANFVAGKIDLAKAAIMGTPRNRTLGSERFVSDLDAARFHIAESVAAYAAWKTGNPKNGKSAQHAGFFESVGDVAGKLVKTNDGDGPITTGHQWLANALAENIDERINAVYEKRTGKKPSYASVFDWLTLKAFKPNDKENAESDLEQIASERGLQAPTRPFDDMPATDSRVDRIIAAAAAVDGVGKNDTAKRGSPTLAL